MIEEFPSLTCQNIQTCGLPIALPRPNHPEKYAGQSAWPTDAWSKNFACPYCGHVYRYTKRNVDGRKSVSISQDAQKAVDMGTLPLVLCLEVKCNSDNCALPVRIHTTSEVSVTKRALAAIAVKWTLHIACLDGHPIERVQQFEFYSEPWEE